MTIAPDPWITTRIPLHGLDSRAAASRILAALRALGGVRAARLEPGSRTAIVEHLGVLDPLDVVTAVRAAGGDPSLAELAMVLAETPGSEASASLVEADLRSLPGVDDAAVDLPIGEILVRYDPRVVDADSIRERIRRRGWEVGHPGASTSAVMDEVEARSARAKGSRALVAGVAGVIVTALGALAGGTIAPVLGSVRGAEAWLRATVPLPPAAALALLALVATAAVIWCGRDLFRGAWRDLASRSATARLAATLAVLALLAGSLASTATRFVGDRPQPLLFGAAIWTLTVVLAAYWIQQRLPVARRRRTRSLTPSAAAPILDRLAWHRGRNEQAAAAHARAWAIAALAAAPVAASLLLAFGAAWTTALLTFSSVLVVAAPASFIAAVAAPFRATIEELSVRGIVAAGSETLETMAEVRTLVSNARGGAFEPAVEVSELLLLDGISSPALLASASSARSDHRSVQELIRGRLTESPARDETLVLGTPAELQALGISMDALREEIDALEGKGKSVLLVARESKLIGGLALALKPRPAAAETIRALSASGVRWLLVTRHAQATAAALAGGLSIHAANGDAGPREKQRILAEAAGPAAWVSDPEETDVAAGAPIALTFVPEIPAASGAEDAIIASSGLDAVLRLVNASRAAVEGARRAIRLVSVYHLMAVVLAAGALYPLFRLVPSPFFAAVASLAATLLAARRRSWSPE